MELFSTPVITIVTNGYYKIVRDDPKEIGLFDTELAIINDGGSFIVDQGIHVDVTALTGGTSGYSYFQYSGDTTLGSSNLVVPAGYVMAGGTFLSSIPSNPNDNLQSVISGHMFVTGGHVFMSPPTSGWGTFEVRGDVSWTGGTYYPTINRSNPPGSSYWTATGTFSVGAGVFLWPAESDQAQTQGSWRVLLAGSVTGDPASLAEGFQAAYKISSSKRAWYLETK